MVDSCTKENGVLYTVAQSWLLFLHDESRKILNQKLFEVLMSCTKHFDFSSSLTASYVARFVISWVCRLYFSGLVCSVLSLDDWRHYSTLLDTAVKETTRSFGKKNFQIGLRSIMSRRLFLACYATSNFRWKYLIFFHTPFFQLLIISWTIWLVYF